MISNTMQKTFDIVMTDDALEKYSIKNTLGKISDFVGDAKDTLDKHLSEYASRLNLSDKVDTVEIPDVNEKLDLVKSHMSAKNAFKQSDELVAIGEEKITRPVPSEVLDEALDNSVMNNYERLRDSLAFINSSEDRDARVAVFAEVFDKFNVNGNTSVGNVDAAESLAKAWKEVRENYASNSEKYSADTLDAFFEENRDKLRSPNVPTSLQKEALTHIYGYIAEHENGGIVIDTFNQTVESFDELTEAINDVDKEHEMYEHIPSSVAEQAKNVKTQERRDKIRDAFGGVDPAELLTSTIDGNYDPMDDLLD